MRFPLYCLLPAACLAIPGESSGQAGLAGPELLPITVLFYDFVDLGPGVKRDARTKLEGILRPAGVALSWIECRVGGRFLDDERCSRPWRGDIFLRLVEGDAVKGSALHLAPVGLTEPDYAGRGRITILVRSVRDLRLGTHWQFPDLLALAMVHEFAHLVGRIDHSASGLMSANWSRSLLGRMTWASLTLSPSELERFRRAAARRQGFQIP